MSDKKKDKKKRRQVDNLGSGMLEFARKLLAGRKMTIDNAVEGTAKNKRR